MLNGCRIRQRFAVDLGAEFVLQGNTRTPKISVVVCRPDSPSGRTAGLGLCLGTFQAAGAAARTGRILGIKQVVPNLDLSLAQHASDGPDGCSQALILRQINLVYYSRNLAKSR